jgi:hypothetical protein
MMRIPTDLRRARFAWARRYDPQPTQRALVLLASRGAPFSREAIATATRLSRGQPVAVVAIAGIHGSAWGLPNPGLMPTRKELETLHQQVQRVIETINRSGAQCFGQVAITRRAEKAIARAAAARGVAHVVIDAPAQPRWRRVVEGDPVRGVQRKVGSGVVVHPVA